jgi:hypothetical protein
VPAIAIDPERPVYGYRFPGRPAYHQRVVGLTDLPAFKSRIQLAVNLCCARKDHHAAGFLIQPVDRPNLAKVRF